MERRAFLKRLVLGTAAGVTSSALAQAEGDTSTYAATTEGGKTILTQQNSPFRFVQGTVVTRGPSQVVLTSSRVAAQVVKLSSRTTVWKEVETGWEAVAPNDFLYVNGMPSPDGGLEALRIWINIGWYHGHIASTQTGSLNIELGRGQRTIYLTPLTLLLQAKEPAAHYQGQLTAGQWVDALGVFVPGGNMRATRIWA